MIVCTSMNNFGEREAIRNTWGAVGGDINSNITLLFLVGSGSSEDVQKQIFNESNLYRDIIQERFTDSYRNLSIKSQAMLKWINSFCLTAKYALKIDDDMYVNVPNLLKAKTSLKTKLFWLEDIYITGLCA
ncbi:lactosylceramide 1,3-N-acetyl-beta-D-glucosaminyltransferase-like, partial [Patella vulgata]|uniref:lactosylceramide 1,3-N-acetyl-beta-D-glucosaminyltransferase-like n=1 Tax=Patella vulgata TaxID=6465 RepID=UPI0024A912AF